MIDFLLGLDVQLLLFINKLNAPWLDELMWQVSSKWINIPVGIVIIYFLNTQLNYRKTASVVLITIGLVLITDSLSTHLFKEVFLRFRPSHDPSLSDQLHFYFLHPNQAYLGGQYGFLSAHAANLAAVFALLYGFFSLKKKLLYIFTFYVVLVGSSRIYLGVHFPLDVLCGFLFGGLMGWLTRKLLMDKILAKWAF